MPKEEACQKKKQHTKGIRLLIMITIVVVLAIAIYIGIRLGYSLPKGQVFRLWFSRTLPITLLLMFQGLVLIWLCVLSWLIKQKYQKSLGKRIGLWFVGILLIFILAVGMLIHMLTNDYSEYFNGDGTVIIKSFVWLDKPRFYLYQEENFLVLRYIRDADGLDDIDTSISEVEYRRKKQEEFEKNTKCQNEKKEEPKQDSKIYQNPQEDERNRKIEEGYQKVYEAYLKDKNSEYKKDYNAKGYSYIIVYEDETQIRYFMYDREDEQGKKAQYVYFQNEKNEDGSWSPVDSEILDMYQYDYATKEVEDLKKTSW